MKPKGFWFGLTIFWKSSVYGVTTILFVLAFGLLPLWGVCALFYPPWWRGGAILLLWGVLWVIARRIFRSNVWREHE